MAVKILSGTCFDSVKYDTADGKTNNGYIVGNQIPGDAMLIVDPDIVDQHARLVGLKYSDHDPGHSKENIRANDDVRLTMLVAGGPWRQKLWDDTNSVELQLNKPGDYIAWMPGVEHEWEALGKATMVTLSFRRPEQGE